MAQQTVHGLRGDQQLLPGGGGRCAEIALPEAVACRRPQPLRPAPVTAGKKPQELFGKFTWKIDNFSEISKRELRSNQFDVGEYKWWVAGPCAAPEGRGEASHSPRPPAQVHPRLPPGLRRVQSPVPVLVRGRL